MYRGELNGSEEEIRSEEWNLKLRITLYSNETLSQMFSFSIGKFPELYRFELPLESKFIKNARLSILLLHLDRTPSLSIVHVKDSSPTNRIWHDVCFKLNVKPLQFHSAHTSECGCV